MPKKACCCRQPEPEENSCCRPIYQACVGKKYTFEVLFKAKYPCFKNNPPGTTPTYSEAQYRCLNNGSLHNIPGNAETFILTIEYEIEKPANLYLSPNHYDREDARVPRNCGYSNYACWPNFDPEILESWPRSALTGQPGIDPPWLPAPSSCVGCNCVTNPIYSFCNFDDEKLKAACGCTEGTYYNQNPTQFWNQCYSFWRLQPPDTNYEGQNQDPPNSGCYSGCTFTQGDPNLSNISNSYTFQFIPNPNIPEQNAPNYEPRLQPDLLNFEVKCNWGEFDELDIFRGYNIILELGIGYKASFNCGTGITEILDIPFQELAFDDFFGFGYYYDGIYVKQKYRRTSLTNDPMNYCVPETSYNYPYTTNNCINSTFPFGGFQFVNRCPDPQTNVANVLYKDEWSNCRWGPPVPVAGSYDFGLFAVNPEAKMFKSCDSSFYEVSWSNHCEYFNLTDDIIVESN